MITLRDVTLRRSIRLLCSAARCTIPPRRKIGVSGANRCGKWSLVGAQRAELETERACCETRRLEPSGAPGATATGAVGGP